MRRILLPLIAILLAAVPAVFADEGKEPSTGGEAKKAPAAPAAKRAVITTSMGTIEVELWPDVAPHTVEVFLGLADGKGEFTDVGDPAKKVTISKPFYDGLVFHRVIKGFMLQGGCPLGTGTGGPGYVFDDEINPALDFTQPYVLAMANAGSRGGKGTNGSQFFITTAPTTWLQGKHTIFGRVNDAASRAVVDSIEAAPTDARDRPKKDVTITTVEIRD
jgi:peptidyl-prolyl cis-trans isomerase A (cyclophilin A)